MPRIYEVDTGKHREKQEAGKKVRFSINQTASGLMCDPPSQS